MTGGVSLAIWMGGLPREINLLAQASTWHDHLTSEKALPEIGEADRPDNAVRALYLRLIDLLDVSVDTDALLGTRADYSRRSRALSVLVDSGGVDRG